MTSPCPTSCDILCKERTSEEASLAVVDARACATGKGSQGMRQYESRERDHFTELSERSVTTDESHIGEQMEAPLQRQA